MAILRVTNPLTAVSLGRQQWWKDKVARHRVREVTGPSSVVTWCGAVMLEALPVTWQPTTWCQRCWGPFKLRDGEPLPHLFFYSFSSDPGPAWTLAQEFGADLELRVRMHAVETIKLCGSKRVARQAARSLGYDPPERILEELPELREHIVYRRPDLAPRDA